MATHRIIVVSGASLVGWDDASDGIRASRVNPAPGSPLLFWRVSIKRGVAAFGKSVMRVQALPITASAALADGALGGALFQWSWGEKGLGGPPVLTVTGGLSAEVNFTFTQENAGHWLLTALRPSNGAAAIHLWVDVTD